MYEVLEAIARHNAKVPVDAAEKRIEIDLITGASAGGMTASILAQNLLYDDGSLRDPYTNKLYRAWVEMVDIIPLLEDVDKKDQKRALLSEKVVEGIGRKLLLDDDDLSQRLSVSTMGLHPAASNRLRIGIAMSNLDGYRYEMPTSGDAPFAYVRFKDQMMCEVERKEDGSWSLQELALVQDGNDGPDEWQPTGRLTWGQLRDAGISSGAFPLAFPLRRIKRSGQGSKASNRFRNREGEFHYTDGGVFENEPVGLARELQAMAADHDRYYLLVKPGPRNPVQKNLENSDLLQTLFRLVDAVIQQAQFQDFIMEQLGKDEQLFNRLFTITSSDSVLIGDVLSAFSGFLEEKFRAYDYNIGRETARAQLKAAYDKGWINFDPDAPEAMPDIDWVVGKHHPDDKDLNWSWLRNAPINTWEEAYSLIKGIADSPGKHGDMADLHRLMHEVKPQTRQVISDQLRDRLANLIDYINQNYLAGADQEFSEEIQSAINEWWDDHVKLPWPDKLTANLPKSLIGGIRERLGKPLFKAIADLLLKSWLKANIIDPPPLRHSSPTQIPPTG